MKTASEGRAALLKFSKPELAILGVLLAIGLVAVGFRLASSSPPPNGTPSAREISFTPASPSTATPAVPQRPLEPAPAPAMLRVHVIGAVRRPGVFSMTEGTRIEDAVRAAGGFTASARPDAINLAEKLTDGQQIVIASAAPTPTTVSSAPVPTAAAPIPAMRPSAPAPTPKPQGPPAVGIISLNAADQAQLERLPGVGPALAQRILEYRRSHGGFRDVEELKQVKGIGEIRFEKIRLYVTL